MAEKDHSYTRKELDQIFRFFCEKYVTTFNIDRVKEDISLNERRKQFEGIVEVSFMREILPSYKEIIKEYGNKIED